MKCERVADTINEFTNYMYIGLATTWDRANMCVHALQLISQFVASMHSLQPPYNSLLYTTLYAQIAAYNIIPRHAKYTGFHLGG